jgi:tetratricopeptide (TPR) repeat protein
MKKIQVFVALILCAWTIKAQQDIAAAKGHIANENYAKAREVLNNYVKTEADANKKAEAYYWLGEAEYRDLIDESPQKALEKAREQYNAGLAISKSNPHCQVGMGKLLLDAKNNKEALKTFDQAIKDSRKKPYKEGHPDIFMLIGDAFLNCTNKNAEQAVSYYTRARDVEPTQALYLLRLGDGNLAKGDAGSAMSAFENASAKDKKNPEIFLKMSRIWKRASKNDLAIQNIQEGLQVDPQYAPLYKDLIELYMDTKQYDKVLPALEKYVPLAGNDFSARRRLVTFLTYQAKDYDRAVVEAEKLLKDDPTQTTMYRWIAWAKASKADQKFADAKGVLGDDAKMLYKESQEASKKLFEVVPADRLVYYDYEFPAKSSMRLGDLEEATKMYKKVFELDSTKKQDFYDQIVEAYYGQKKFKEGLDMFDEKEASGVKINKARDYYYAMAYAFSLKDYPRAIKYADKYIESFPNYTDGYHYKALSQAEIDDDNTPKWLAKETYEKMVQTYEAKPDAASANQKTHVARGYNYIGTYYGANNDLVKAKEFFQKTIGVDPSNKTATEALQQLGN